SESSASATPVAPVQRAGPARAPPVSQVLAHLAAAGVQALSIGKGVLRFVFHLDIGDADVEVILAALSAYR
ncbi:MAG: hypothetical protein WCH32_12260, partial [Pseudomonadota bacterium]